MCSEQCYTEDAIKEMHKIALECELNKLFKSRTWKIVRSAYPDGNDAELLYTLVRYEALRIALKENPPQFGVEEFERQDIIFPR